MHEDREREGGGEEAGAVSDGVDVGGYSSDRAGHSDGSKHEGSHVERFEGAADLRRHSTLQLGYFLPEGLFGRVGSGDHS